MSIESPVQIPCPISECARSTVTVSSGATRTNAFGSGSCFAAGSGLAGAAPPVSICAITAPTCTVSPWAAVILTSLPSNGEGISALTLSVITSTRGSSRLTKSPSFFSHLSTVPSVTDSPSCGILIGERAMRWNRV